MRRTRKKVITNDIQEQLTGLVARIDRIEEQVIADLRLLIEQGSRHKTGRIARQAGPDREHRVPG
jgi:hypothetical protein